MVLIYISVLFAFIVKASVGFGDSLILVAAASYLLPMHEAIAFSASVVLIADVYLTFRFKKDILLREMIILSLFAFIGVGAGLLVYRWINPELLKKVFAFFILLFSALTISGEKKKLDNWVAPIAGFISGFLSTVIGTGGPVIIMYLEGRPKKKVRATATAVFLVYDAVRYIGYLLVGTATVTKTTMLSIIPLVLGAYIGMQLHNRLQKNIFKKATAVLLGVIALTLLF